MSYLDLSKSCAKMSFSFLLLAFRLTDELEDKLSPIQQQKTERRVVTTKRSRWDESKLLSRKSSNDDAANIFIVFKRLVKCQLERGRESSLRRGRRHTFLGPLLFCHLDFFCCQDSIAKKMGRRVEMTRRQPFDFIQSSHSQV